MFYSQTIENLKVRIEALEQRIRRRYFNPDTVIGRCEIYLDQRVDDLEEDIKLLKEYLKVRKVTTPHVPPTSRFVKSEGEQ